ISRRKRIEVLRRRPENWILNLNDRRGRVRSIKSIDRGIVATTAVPVDRNRDRPRASYLFHYRRKRKRAARCGVKMSGDAKGLISVPGLITVIAAAVLATSRLIESFVDQGTLCPCGGGIVVDRDAYGSGRPTPVALLLWLLLKL